MRTGVYRLFDRTGVLLYVGIGERPPTRWSDHRRTKHWWLEVDECRTTVDWFDQRDLAADEELRAIASEKPIYNKAGTLKLRKPLATGYQMPEPFVGTHEIRTALGVSRQRIQQIMAEQSFPAAQWELAAGRVWLTNVIKEWMAVNRLGPA